MNRIWSTSAGNHDDNNENDDEGESDNSDQHLFVFPPHSVFHASGGVPHVERLVAHDFALLDEDFNFLTPFDDLVHVAHWDLLELGELLLKFWELVDSCFVTVEGHILLEHPVEILQGVGHCRVPPLLVVLVEELLLDLLQVAYSDSGFVLSEWVCTVESTITRKTKPSFTKV